MYAMFETAIRAGAQRTPEEHVRHVSDLWARMSSVAAGNPHSWSRTEHTAATIATPSRQNRMIAAPYSKLMVSNSHVDMAAAVIVCSARRAKQLRVPRDRWVHLHAGVESQEPTFVGARRDLDRAPAIEAGGRRVLELAGTTPGELEIVDLYSCFPSAVEMGAASIGLPLTRQLTRTGGLSFAGGPWNSYALHAIATVADDVRQQAGELGLVWANGGYLTKHSFGIMGSEPPPAGYRWEALHTKEVKQRVRDIVTNENVSDARIAAYTVSHSREGQPVEAHVLCRACDGRSAWGRSADPATVLAMTENEWVGHSVHVHADSCFELSQ
jgi:acetyl-CoA C-acetyltransferase